MKKRFYLTIMLCIAVCFVLTGCGNTEKEKNDEAKEELVESIVDEEIIDDEYSSILSDRKFKRGFEK